MPSSWKKVPLKCLLPPSGSLCNATDTSGKPAILTKYFPRLIPIALAGLYSNTLGVLCVYERCCAAAALVFYELLMAARLHPLTWRIWLLLFVSLHAIEGRATPLRFDPTPERLGSLGKIPRRCRWTDGSWNFLLPSLHFIVAGLFREKTRLEKVEANCASRR